MKEIEKRGLSSEVFERLKSLIVSGKLTEGEKIPSENQLSVSLKVSRVIIRDALEELRRQHYIVTYRGKGSYVANAKNFKTPRKMSLTFKEFKDVMELRAAIEYAAIRTATAMASDEQLTRISDVARQMAECIDDVSLFTRYDYMFHNAILEASGNSLFIRIMEQHENEIFSCLEAMNILEESRQWAVDLHMEIADKISHRDSRTAIDLLKRNGEYNLARMNEIYEYSYKK